MAVSSPRWLLVAGFLVGLFAILGAREAWADGIRASDAMDAINSGRQQFLQGLRGALAAVAAQKDNLVEELLEDVEDEEEVMGQEQEIDEEEQKEEEEEEEEEIEEELGLLDPPNVKTLEIRLPNAEINKSDKSACTATSLSEAQQELVGFRPLINQDDVSQIILYGCPDQAASNQDYWTCNNQNLSSICQGPIAIMFEWSRDSCDNYLAMGDAITIGGGYIHNVVLMVRYNEGGLSDSTGLALKIMPSSEDGGDIEKAVEFYSRTLDDPDCPSKTTLPSYSSSLSPYDPDYRSIASDNPEMAQYYYRSSSSDMRDQYDYDARSQGRSSSSDGQVKADVDESIPLSSNQQGVDSYMENVIPEGFIDPASSVDADDWLMRLEDYWHSANALAYGMTLRGWWPRDDDVEIGQVAGIATDSTGKLSLLHRADRRWEDGDFDGNDRFLIDEPISEKLVLTLDPDNGEVLSSWGSDLFYMPHGLYIDSEDNMWITDVALHQVLKFPSGSRNPSLVLGERFVPGRDLDHFCKPTDVAVDSRTGEFYVADGYCNNRILKFSSNGTVLMEITAGTIPGDDLPSWSPLRSLRIPHSLALIKSRDIICVADRENARIQCFNVTSGDLERQIASPMFGEQLFAISYNEDEDVLYAVNGPNEAIGVPPLAFTLNVDNGEILSKWDPYPKAFGVIHDIATYSPQGAVYMADIGLDRVWKFEATSGTRGNAI